MTIHSFAKQAATDQSRFFDGEFDALNGFVADITTIARFQCERWEDYTDIETL